MKKLEEYLKTNATYDPATLNECDIANELNNYELRFLAEGTQSRVFRIKDKNWVVKEGRWDFKIDLMPNFKLSLPAEQTDQLLRLFSVSFLPKPDVMSEQYDYYLKFAHLMGYFDSKSGYSHSNIGEIFKDQKNLRNALPAYIQEIDEKYNTKFGEQKIEELLEDESVKYHNFLPKEYLLIGKSISKENKEKNTFYIFQEFVNGIELHDVPDDKYDNKTKKELALMLYLLLLFHHLYGLLPDMRPRHTVMEAMNWTTNTDNVIVSDLGLKFIDTRWFWEVDSNFVRRGFIVPDIMIRQTKSFLGKLLDELY